MRKNNLQKIFTILISAAMVLSITLSVNAVPQPRMTAALVHLQKAKVKPVGGGKKIQLNKAKNQMQKAAHNKGGHRVAAINFINRALIKINQGKMGRAQQLINKAINQVNKGIEAGNG